MSRHRPAFNSLPPRGGYGVALGFFIPPLVAVDTDDEAVLGLVDAALIEPIATIGKSLEGKTERQKNPYRKGSLAWLAWISARLGGWNCYDKPPGPKTMATRWKQLAAMLEGYAIAVDQAHV